MDRLLYAESGARLAVANSLPLLLAATGGQLDPHHDYRHESWTSLDGIWRYDPTFSVLGPADLSYRQLIYRSMTLRDGSISCSYREPGPSFRTFEDYSEHLRLVLARLAQNARDRARRRPMEITTTLSSGYDSTAAATMARELGAAECFNRPRSNSVVPRWLSPGHVDDSGTGTAEALGMRCVPLPSGVPANADDELSFLAATAAGKETVFHGMAAHMHHRDRPTVIFTGYHGGKVWDVATPDSYVTDDILRGDASGLGLAEVRLRSGFINAPLPFIGARRIADLRAISRSPEMQPWRLGNTYDRPIPRRIAEEAGVPRTAFGQRKRAVWEQRSLPQNATTRRLVLAYWHRLTGISPVRAHLAAGLRRGHRLLNTMAAKSRILPIPKAIAGDRLNLPSLTFIAANAILAERMAKHLGHTLNRQEPPTQQP